MKHYVAGFYFDKDQQRVALVLKNRPAWQKGRLNAIGGKIEPGESAQEAIAREFSEETGVTSHSWEQFLILNGDDWQVVFFRDWGDPGQCVTREDEEIYVYPIKQVLANPKLISNLQWILPLALDSNLETPITINYLVETL